MSHQLFKHDLSQNILNNFLNENCEKMDSYYFLDKCAFKKSKLNKTLDQFLKHVESCYFQSKKKYIQRTMNYKNTVVVIRQVCKYFKFPFLSHINYNKSKYDLSYKIYFDL
jgi:predicted HD phosphohydrolase